MPEPSPLAARSDLPWLAELGLPAGRLAGPAATRRLGSRRELAARLEVGDWLGVDLVHALVNGMLAAGTLPRSAELHVTAPRGDDLAPAAVAGIARACRGQAIALSVGRAALGPVTEVEVRCGGGVVAAPAGEVRAGDVVVGLRSSGPTDFDSGLLLAHAAELGLQPDDLLPNGDTVMRTVLAPRCAHTSVLFTPLTQRWPGRRAAVGDGTLAGAIVSLLPTGCAVEFELSKWAAPAPFDTWFAGSALESVVAASSCGVGFVIVAAERDAERWCAHCAEWNEPAAVIGRVRALG